MASSFDIQLAVRSVIDEIKPYLRSVSLAEQLDSLHRIFVVEKLEEKLGIPLRTLLFDRETWQSLESLVQAIERKLTEK